MIKKIRQSARRFLPATVRKPLGVLGGKFYAYVCLPIMGFLFDLSGGRFQTDGCVFHVPKDITSIQFRACFLTGTHEVDERKLISNYILPSDAILELGGCLGVVSCLVNKRLANPANHLVVEANPNCIPVLHRNRNLNHAGFLIEHCAAANQPRVEFFLNRRFITGSTTVKGDGLPVQVPGRSLAELAGRYGPFSVLIMDIEGGELAVLPQAVQILSQLRLVIVELHEAVIGADGVAQCRNALQAAGLKWIETSQITEVWVRSK